MASNYKVTLYRFNELSESAKSVVICKEREDVCSFGVLAQDEDADDRINTLKSFCSLFDINFRIDYDHSTRFVDWHFVYSGDEELEERKGKYLWRFLNRYYFDIRKPKYYFTKGYWDENRKYHYKYRYSKVQYTEGNCPFTGVCYDEDILKPIFDWYKNPNMETTIHDLFEECFSYFLQCWERDDDYRMSDEYLADMIENNWGDKLYFESGIEFNGNESDLEIIAA